MPVCYELIQAKIIAALDLTLLPLLTILELAHYYYYNQLQLSESKYEEYIERKNQQ